MNEKWILKRPDLAQFASEYKSDWERVGNYKSSYDQAQDVLLKLLINKEVCVHSIESAFIVIWNNGALIQIPKTVWLKGVEEMLCTICKQRIGTDHAYVWRTLDTIKSGKPVQWAHMPVHHKCKDLVEHEVMKAKIGIAAGLDCYNYALEKPAVVDERPINSQTGLRNIRW